MIDRYLRPATDAALGHAFGRPARGLPDSPEWFAAFKHACGIHGLGPFLGLRLRDGEIDVPDMVGAWLTEQLARNETRLTRMHRELFTILDACRSAGVRAIPLKGAALLLDGPDARPWRTMSDLDLLIPDVSIHEVERVLAAAGYRLVETSWKHQRYTARDLASPVIVGDGEHPDNPRDVEVHQAVVEMFRGFRWDLTPLITNRLEGHEGVECPTPEAMVLHLTVHCSLSLLDGAGRAIQLIDLAGALKRALPGSVVEDVRRAGIRQHARFAFPALALAARATGEPLARDAARALQPHVPAPMVAWVESTSLYDVSWAGRNSHGLLHRHAIWALDRRERLAMLQHTFAPDRTTLATQGHNVGTASDALRSYLAHYKHLSRRLRSSG